MRIGNHGKAAGTPTRFSLLLHGNCGGPEAMGLGDLSDKALLAVIQRVEKGTNLPIARIHHDRFVRQLCAELIEEC